MRILLQLQSKKLDNGKVNPKNYPFADELKELIKDHELCEINGPLPLQQSKDYIKWADKIICIDSYLQHLCWYEGKKAIVLWGQSDPLIFGHSENINLLRDRKYLRERQFGLWTQTECNNKAFVLPEVAINSIIQE